MNDSRRQRVIAIWTTVSCIALSIMLHLPYMYAPVDLDEGNYATIGMMVSKGTVLYRDIGDSKPPLIYYIDALISAISGGTPITRLLFLRLSYVVALGATGVFVFFIARRFYENMMALASAYLFVIFASSPIFGFFSPTTVFGSLFESAAVYFLVKAFDSERRKMECVMVGGILVGLSTLTRQTSILLFAAIILWYFVSFFRKKSMLAKHILCITAGAGLAFLPIIIFSFFTSAYNDMIYWVLLEPLPGVVEHSPWTPQMKIQWFLNVVLAVSPILLLAAVAMTEYFLNRSKRELLFVLWFIIPVLSIGLGPVPAYSHYYYQILPPLCVMAGKALTSFRLFWQYMNTKREELERSFRGFAPSIVSIALGVLVISASSSLIFNIGAGRELVSRNDVKVAVEVADFIKNQTAPDERIFVFETLWSRIGPMIYYLSERSPALPRTFFFTHIPEGLTMRDVESVEEALSGQDVKYVALIGLPPPVDWPSRKVLLAVLSNYYSYWRITKDYIPYPSLPPVEVTVYKRIDSWNGQIESITLDPIQSANLIADSDFDRSIDELNMSNWKPLDGMNSSRDSDVFNSSPASMELTGLSPTGAWNYVDYTPPLSLSPNSMYTMEIAVKITDISDPNNRLLARIEQYDSSGNWLGNVETSTYELDRIGTWQLLTWNSADAPLDPLVDHCLLRIGKYKPSPVNITFYFDDVKVLEESYWLTTSSTSIHSTKDEHAEQAVEGNESIQISYDFGATRDGWVTIGRRFNRTLAGLQNASLSLWVKGDGSENLLHIDLSDEAENFRRFSLLLDFNGWKRLVIPISDTFFSNWSAKATSFDEICSLHLVIQKQPIGSTSGAIFIDGVQILHRREEQPK